MLKTINCTDYLYSTISFDTDELQKLMMEIYNKHHYIGEKKKNIIAKNEEEVKKILNKSKIFDKNIYHEIIKINEKSRYRLERYYDRHEHSYNERQIPTDPRFEMWIKTDIFPKIVFYMDTLLKSDNVNEIKHAYEKIMQFEYNFALVTDLERRLKKHKNNDEKGLYALTYKETFNYPNFDYEELSKDYHKLTKLIKTKYNDEEFHKMLTYTLK